MATLVQAQGNAQGLEQIRLEFRELLTICQLDQQPWLWYAEMVTWDAREDWVPLLGLRYRTNANDNVNSRWFDYKDQNQRDSFRAWYEELLAATERGDVLSIVATMREQFERDGNGPSAATRPIFGSFRAGDADLHDDNALQEALKQRAEAKKALGNRYTSIPRGEGDIKKYKQYVNLLVNRQFDIPSFGKVFLYPKYSWLFGLPIYELRDKRPVLLASILLFTCADEQMEEYSQVEAETDGHPNKQTAKGAVADLFYEIQRYLLDLEVKATHLLTHRYHGMLEGFMPGYDPIVLLAHPALTQEEYRSRISLHGDHHQAGSFLQSGFGALKKTRHKNARYYERVFERSLAPLRRLNLEATDKFIHLGIFDPLQYNQKLFLKKLKIEGKNGYASWHRWLKSLYAHSPAQAMLPVAPSTENNEYALSIYHLAWLVPLLEAAFLDGSADGGDAGKESGAGQPSCSLGIKSNIWAGIARAPENDKIKSAVESDVQEDNFFLWPIQPGIRFLIPWLHLVKHLHRTIYDTLCRKKAPDNTSPKIAILLPGGGNDAPEPFPVCLKRLPDQARGGNDMSGLWVAYPLPDNPDNDEKVNAVKRAVAGWRSALFDPVGRRGDDTLPFTWLQTGDIGAVLKHKHLLFETPAAILQPMVGTMAIHLDFFVDKVDKHNYFFLCTSWRHRQPVKKGGAP